jgi:hypothetical protein
MEEQMDVLRSCLMERLSLTKERTILIVKESDIISPRAYLDCQIRLDEAQSRLHKLSYEIPRLTAHLRAYYSAAGCDQPMSTPSAEQDAAGGLAQDVDAGGEARAGP